jgi:mono/diheme cytochrome c family protein
MTRGRRSVASGITLLCAIVTAVSFMRGLKAQTTATTVWDGVYTSEQADRGQLIYDRRCAECHQDDLSGGGDEGAAALRGADFVGRWNNMPLAALFRKIERSMPKSRPGSLTPNATADVIAFLLRKNQMPASNSEMSGDAAKLEGIAMTEKAR